MIPGRLSIIVTFYDETPFLRSALQSVRNQGIDDLELIVVNDNPDAFDDDALRALTDPFDARIVHHRVNKGLSAARNTGIDAANGEWIGFLDADDYYTIGGLAEQFDYARETGADITHAACVLGDEGGATGSLLNRDRLLHMQQRVVEGRMIAQEAQFIVSSWSSLYRTEFLDQNDLWFDIEQRKFEDRLFVLNVVTKARRIAFLGKPARVWRRRANSISSARTTPETHLLQVQLLEKCMAHIRAETEAFDLAPRFEKRELFNCVSRLIWDMDIIPHLAAAEDPAYLDMGARIQVLLGDDAFGHPIFNDPMVATTSRVGMRTRRGRITRTDFFALHKALREGAFADAHALMLMRAPAPALPKAGPAHRQKRLVLHVGLHKTGTTFLQHHLLQHRDALRRMGVLVPQTGFNVDVQGRPGALSGHQGLVRALRHGDDATWADLHAEIAASPARTVVISAENMGFPTAPDRDDLIAALFARLGHFAQVQVVAVARRADIYAEAFWREWVCTGHPAGCRSLPEFLVDHRDTLTNLEALFAPFEAHAKAPVRLADFDALLASDRLWQGFCKLAGLRADLPELDAPRYPSPDRDAVQLMQLLNMIGPDTGRRARIMAAYFAAPPPPRPGADQSLLAPTARRALLDGFEENSSTFAASRGFAPDLDAARADLEGAAWVPPSDLPLAHLHALLDTAAQELGEATANAATPRSVTTVTTHPQEPASPPKGPGDRTYKITIQPRPWVQRLLNRALSR